MSPASRWTSTAAASTARRDAGIVAGEHALDGDARSGDVALGQPQQRDTGRRIPPELPCVVVGAGGRRELTAQPMQLALLVAGDAERRVEGIREACTGELRLGDRRRPVSVRLQHLRAVDQALPTVGTRSGSELHHARKASVHSVARRRSNTSTHASITAQYTIPAGIGVTSPVVTDTITSSSSRTPRLTSPSASET